MKAIQLKQVCKGCLFHLSDSDSSPLWVRSVYEPFSKKYEIYSFDNVNVFRYRLGSLIVFVED